MLAAPTPTPVDFFTGVRFEPAGAAVLVIAAGWYAWAARRVRAKGTRWPVSRSACFAVAWVLVAVAEFSGLSRFATANFSASMSLYLLVGVFAPALLALSAPLTLAVRSSSASTRGAVFERPVFKVVGHPFVTWLPFNAAMFVLFLSPLYGNVVGGRWAQQLVFLGLLVVGFVYFWPLAGADPGARRLGHWPRILYLLLDFPAYAILGMALESQTHLIVPQTSLASLHLGAAVLWVFGESVAMAGAIILFLQWLRADERRARSHDLAAEAAAARQLALWRASRDAATRAASR